MADNVQNAVMLAFNETVYEDHLKNLLERINLPDNCKVAQAKLVNLVNFSTVSSAIRSTDIKLRDFQKNFSNGNGNFSNANDMESKTKIIQIILDGLKLTGHGNQSMNKLRKKYFLSGVSEDYKDM